MVVSGSDDPIDVRADLEGQLIAFRPALYRDDAFIVSAWSSSFRLSPSAGLICMDDWADIMHVQIRKMLGRPGVQTIVAHETDPDIASPGVSDLLGFACVDTTPRVPYVLYVYVKAAYRNAGIARRLLRHAEVDPSKRFDFACWTEAVATLGRSGKIPLARHRPLYARFPKEPHEQRTEETTAEPA